jgi:hypothetical protein
MDEILPLTHATERHAGGKSIDAAAFRRFETSLQCGAAGGLAGAAATGAATRKQLIDPMTLAPYCTKPPCTGGEWAAVIGR